MKLLVIYKIDMYVTSLSYTPGVPNILQLTSHIQNLYLYCGLYIPVNFDEKFTINILKNCKIFCNSQKLIKIIFLFLFIPIQI